MPWKQPFWRNMPPSPPRQLPFGGGVVRCQHVGFAHMRTVHQPERTTSPVTDLITGCLPRRGWEDCRVTVRLAGCAGCPGGGYRHWIHCVSYREMDYPDEASPICTRGAGRRKSWSGLLTTWTGSPGIPIRQSLRAPHSASGSSAGRRCRLRPASRAGCLASRSGSDARSTEQGRREGHRRRRRWSSRPR
jgi:hypothetical protein